MHAPKTEGIARLVHAVRGERVLFDSDLARLYGVSTKVLNQAVKRNRERFPTDFMFRLTAEEWEAMRSQSVTASPNTRNWSQIVTSSSKHRGAPYQPYAFTEQGVAMLSSVLRSPRAVEVNIAIMRTFVQLRRLMDSNRQPARKIAVVFEAIKRLIADEDARKASPRRGIGFVG